MLRPVVAVTRSPTIGALLLPTRLCSQRVRLRPWPAWREVVTMPNTEGETG